MRKEGAPRVEVGDEDIVGPVTDPDKGLPPELVPGAREASRMKEDAPEGTAPPAVERTGTAAPEAFDRKQEKRLKKMSAKLQKIQSDMGHAADRAVSMVPSGEVQDPKQREMAELARQARELAAQADEVAREGTLKALGTLEKGDPDRLEGIVDYLRRWPDASDEMGGLDLGPAELAVAAARLAADDPESFVRAIGRNDLGLSQDEKLAIAEQYRFTAPMVLAEAVRVMRFPTGIVRELVKDTGPEVRSQVFSRLNIPEVTGELSDAQMSDLERQEMKDESVGRFEETGRTIALEIMRAFPDRAERERERADVEAELHRGIVAAQDFGKSFTAPMVVRFEGRAMPALYKAQKRELAADKEFEKENGRTVRPGIESGSSPSREWLAYQIDKALQLDIVPATVIRSGPEGRGSVQDWQVSEGMREMPWYEMAQNDASFRAELAKVALFDLITENTDRHTGNFVRSPDGKVVAIDNGLIAPKPLSGIDHVRSFPLWSLEGKPVPQELRALVTRLKGAPEVMDALKQGFGLALGEDAERAWQAFSDRLDQVEGMESFPTSEELAAEGNDWHIYDKMPRERYAQA